MICDASNVVPGPILLLVVSVPVVALLGLNVILYVLEKLLVFMAIPICKAVAVPYVASASYSNACVSAA